MLLKDAGERYVLEVREPRHTLIDPSPEFFGYEGSRDIIKNMGDGETILLVMGFKLVSDGPVAPQQRNEHGDADVDLVAEDEILGQKTESAEGGEGTEVPQEGKLVMVPTPTDKVEKPMVWNIQLKSSLQALEMHSQHVV